MKLWKKIGSAIGLGLGYLLISGQAAITNPGFAFTDFEAFVNFLVRALMYFAGVVLLIVLIYGGFLYMTSGGNEEQSNKAKTLIRDAVIGIIVVALSWALTSFFLTRFFTGQTGPELPQ